MPLNADQQRAVDSDDNCEVVACPGSGKTSLLTAKMDALIKRHGPATRIVAVTFTKDAARSLEHRAKKIIGASIFDRLCRVGTFHSLAIRLLRNHKKLRTVASPAQSNGYLRRAMKLTDNDLTYEEATAILEVAKTSIEPCPEQQHPFYLNYAQLLSNAQQCDLYDVLRDCVVMMQNKEIQPYPAKFMLVDEFQDTDKIQLLWVLAHAAQGTIVTIVGDDDQSIYSFRGSMGYQGMSDFSKATNAKRITLGINYRCRAEILTAADKLIRNNSDRINKQLVSARGAGGSIHSRRFGDSFSEAADIVAEASKGAVALNKPHPLFSLTHPPETWAVLARGKRQLDEVENALQSAGIQYYRASGDAIWSRPPFVHILSLLQSLQTAQAAGIDAALHHALASRVTSSDAQRVLNDIHAQLGDRFSTILDGARIDLSRMTTEEQQVVNSFQTRTVAWRKQLRDGRIGMVVTFVFDWFASFERSKDAQDLLARLGETVKKLKGSLVERAALLADIVPRAKREDFKTSADSPDGAIVDERPWGVALQTMHGSKGLEFDNVWIVGTEGTSIPSPKSTNLEEERRLMYVAITRTRDHLFISSTLPETPSIFVEEAGCGPKTLFMS